MVSIIDGNFSNGSTRVSVNGLNGVTTLGYRTLGEGIFYYEILCENDSIQKRIGVSENLNQGWVSNGRFNKAIYPVVGNILAGSIYGVILDLSGSIGKMSWNLNGGDFSDWIELKDYYGNVINFFRVAIVGSASTEGDKYFKIIYDKNSFITDVEKIFKKIRSNVFYSFDGNYKVSDRILILNDNKTYSLERINTWHKTKMTSNTTPAPFVASASSIWSSVYVYDSWKAFNGTNIDIYDCWITADGQVKGWIQIDFGERKLVNMLMLTSRNASDPSLNAVSGFPKDIIIHGSNDGNNFEQIKSFNSLSVTTYNETITLKLPTSYYRIYRLEILSNNGNTRFTTIGEILYGLKEGKVINIPSISEQNFINYGMYSPIQFDGVLTNKNYILQDGVSKNENGYWTTKLDRKPLGIKFE